MTFGLKLNEVQVSIHADIIEQSAMDQIALMEKHPSIRGHFSVMPDVHQGAGCVIGSTFKFGKSIVPNFIGVDIGCGVLSYKLGSPTFKMVDFDNFVKENIPMGFKSHATDHPICQSTTIIDSAKRFLEERNLTGNPGKQIGTLGGGNHFIEIEVDGKGIQYLTVHTGSRNFGKQVADYYQNKAKNICEEMNIDIPKDMEYLPMSKGGSEYLQYLNIAQYYASLNRKVIINTSLQFFGLVFDTNNVIESVHNYIDSTGIVRKGAISARANEQVIIPLNMGEGIVLGVGKGNPVYNWSAPHGAGRVAGRREMFRQLENGTYTMDAYRQVMSGVFSTTVSEKTFDESPFAYKSYVNIEKHLKETVDIKEVLKSIYNIKSEGD